MNISIIGTGYVGLTQGIGLAKLGHKIICVDIVPKKIEKISKGDPGIYEPKMEEYLKEILNKNFEISLDLEYAIKNSDIIFICVPTPSKEDGSMESKYIESATKDVGKQLGNKYKLIVIKSTVVPGTTQNIIESIEKVSGKSVGKNFGICMNPEFLQEGKALEDFFNPDRIVIGEYDKKSGDMLSELYKKFNCPVLRTDLKTAEMIKYVSNSLLATKVAFANEIGNICKNSGIDVYKVMEGVGLDKRINPKFLNAGIGFGGSCFPKDVKSLISYAKSLDSKTHIINSALDQNMEQKEKIIELAENEIGDFDGKNVALLGLSFKPNTDDIREAPSINIIKILLEKKAIIKVYDPKAMDNTKKLFPEIEYCNSVSDTLKDGDVCLILTDWEEFKTLKDEDFEQMRNKLIIEGRKVLDKKNVSKFEGVCW